MILAVYDANPLPQRPYSITLNTMVSVLSTLAREIHSSRSAFCKKTATRSLAARFAEAYEDSDGAHLCLFGERCR